MKRDAFERLVSEALDELPKEFGDRLDNIDVVIQGWPTRGQLIAAGLHPDRQTLFGLYQGVPQTKRGRSYGLVPPDKITIFQGPIEVHFRTDPAIRAAVKRTVIHEIAHHFGISDERLRELGVY